MRECLIDNKPDFLDRLRFKRFWLVDDKREDSSVVIEPNVPAVNETDWNFADKRDGHVEISVLVNERRSAWSFVAVDNGGGLGGKIKSEVNELFRNDEEGMFEVAVVELSVRRFDLDFFDDATEK